MKPMLALISQARMSRRLQTLSAVLLLRSHRIRCLALSAACAGSCCIARADGQARSTYDVIVYGGTAGGVIAAVLAAREGLHVAVLEPSNHVGGMVTGGLSSTDYGKREVIGGYAREFYHRIGHHYGKETEWRPEPHVAECILVQMLREAGVTVLYGHRLREKAAVTMKGRQVASVRTGMGVTFYATIFIDASYEGDLMKQAGVSYTIGREAQSQYHESLAGVRPKELSHQFTFSVPGYDENHKLLPQIQKDPLGQPGGSDKKIQAYNYRLILTKDRQNGVAFPKPADYDPKHFELLLRFLAAYEVNKHGPPPVSELFLLKQIAGNKWDFNNHGEWFSTDYIGKSWRYPDGSYRSRKAIWKDHTNYTQGLLYFVTHDPRVPKKLRDELSEFGLARDEFADNHSWPYQLYIREARRMVGDFVMTQKDLQVDPVKPDAIGMGSYSIDSHNVQRYLNRGGNVQYEGSMYEPVTPYQIPYRLLLPKRREVINLLVTVCFSASHVAYSSLRMEPQYMIVGQAAGVAAKMAIDKGVAVQDIDTKALSARLRSQGVVMEWEASTVN